MSHERIAELMDEAEPLPESLAKVALLEEALEKLGDDESVHRVQVLTQLGNQMILGETALSFLGLGLRPPVTSWGVLLSEAQSINAVALYPWLMIPGLAVVVVVLTFNFLGDGLRDAADPYH